MEKRAILAIVLSLCVVVLWSIFLAPPSPPPVEREPIEQATRMPPASAPTPMPQVPSSQSVSASQATQVVVYTGVAELTLTGQGAGVQSVKLLDYHTTLDKNATPIVVAPRPGIPGVPLEAKLQLGGRTVSLGHVVFTPTTPTSTIELSPEQPEATVTFRGTLRDGIVVERTYHFRHNSYVFQVSTAVEGFQASEGSTMTLLWGPGLLQQQDSGEVERRGQTEPVPRSFVNQKIQHKAPGAVGEQYTAEGSVTWTALGDTYFAAVLLPQDPSANAATMRRVGKEETTTYEVGIRTPFEGVPQTVQVYVGPKAHSLLQQVEPSLGKLIDLGFFSPLARPMLQFLIVVNRWFDNYGITIIVVTFLIKIAFWPLTVKSFKSMQAMQTLQPKVKELQARYKDDRQRMNQAMMQLYRDEKVNPMGGCLPMLLQIPVFFAFYNALLYSIELRHAPFICWDGPVTWLGRGICDLSVYDPTYITPILMGVSMFLQQKMTPTTADPTQAKVMQFMPLIFLLFFLKAPSGLVIYWLLNNVLSIAQQYLSNRMGRRATAAAGAVSKG